MFDPDLWPRIRRSIQPRCDAMGTTEGDIDNKITACYVLVQTGRDLGCHGRERHLRTRCHQLVNSRPLRPRTMAIRSHRYLRSPHGHYRSRPLTQRPLGAISVAAYIAGAYFFTSSTSFANPAVTIAEPSQIPSQGSNPQVHRCSSSAKSSDAYSPSVS